MIDLHPLFDALATQGGSDLLLQCGSEPVVRLDGSLVRVEHPVVTEADMLDLLQRVTSPSRMAELEAERQVDFALGLPGGMRVRGNAFYQRGTLSIAFRLLPVEIPTFADLGVPAAMRSLVELPRGLVLVTGPTGSGKTTTLAAMLDWINHHRACHVVTIEDPIEFVHANHLAVVDQREVGTDTPSFAAALRGIFRQDPDVILVGEMRDHETIASALTIAETGHLVLATLHTNDSAQTLDRVVDVFEGAQQRQVRTQLANCLAAAVHQQLLPAVGGGRVAAFEILLASSAVKNMIRDNKTGQLRNVISTSFREGMQTLERSLGELCRAGVITMEQARARSMFPDEIT